MVWVWVWHFSKLGMGVRNGYIYEILFIIIYEKIELKLMWSQQCFRFHSGIKSFQCPFINWHLWFNIEQCIQRTINFITDHSHNSFGRKTVDWTKYFYPLTLFQKYILSIEVPSLSSHGVEMTNNKVWNMKRDEIEMWGLEE